MRKLLGILLVIFVIPYICVLILTNCGANFFVRAIGEEAALSRFYPYWRAGMSAELLSRALYAFELALKISPAEPVTQWGYGRAALAMGRADKAVRVLQVSDALASRNPLRYLDTLIAYSYIGDEVAVSDLADCYWEVARTQVVSDVVALLYLDSARVTIASGDWERASLELQEALEWRPSDLYANYYMWRYALLEEDRELVEVFEKRLRYFMTSAVTVTDERLIDYLVIVFPYLLRDGFWDIQRSQNIIAYWVWQYPESIALKNLLQTLISEHPNRSQWQLLLEELNVRLHQQEKGRFVEPLLTHDFASGSSSLDQVLAQLLDVAVETVDIGENLIVGDTFVSLDLTIGTFCIVPQEWLYHINGRRLNWQFAAGRDNLERAGSVRIVDLWWPEVDVGSAYQPYAQYRGSSFQTPSEWVVLSLWYKTEGSINEGDVFVALTPTGRDRDLLFVHEFLPGTSGQWRQFIIVGQAPSDVLRPIVRNWGVATVWFHDIAVYPIELSIMPTRCIEKPCSFLLLGGEIQLVSKRPGCLVTN